MDNEPPLPPLTQETAALKVRRPRTLRDGVSFGASQAVR
jgi:hypothetical protein